MYWLFPLKPKIDIDECANREANCGPDQICKNKPGGYVCVCPAGFIISQNRNCEDVNECEYFRDRKPCPSNADCINTRGSFRCECKSGFKNDPSDDRVCVRTMPFDVILKCFYFFYFKVDVDECKEYPGLCHQRCVNYWGSYKCGCNTGFKLNENNRTCVRI